MASFLRKQVNNVGDRDARKADTVYNVILKTSFFIKKKNFYGFKTTSRHSLISIEAISSKHCLTSNPSLSITKQNVCFEMFWRYSRLNQHTDLVLFLYILLVQEWMYYLCLSHIHSCFTDFQCLNVSRFHGNTDRLITYITFTSIRLKEDW